MSTLEDFENAPVGATASQNGPGRAWKEPGMGEYPWWAPFSYEWLSNKEMAEGGYVLNRPTPTTAKEALDLAWELAHPVNEGQVVPEGAKWMKKVAGNVQEATMSRDYTVTANDTYVLRTHEPLPDPEPDWLNAPAVMALVKGWVSCADPQVFSRGNKTGTQSRHEGYWRSSLTGLLHHWTDLISVVPLYPKETNE